MTGASQPAGAVILQCPNEQCAARRMDGEGQPEPRQWSAEVRQYDHGWYFVEDSDYCPACYALGEPVED